MMKYVLLVALVVAVAQAFPQQPKGRDLETTIEKFVNENQGDGPYTVEVKLSDGQETNAKGDLKPNPDPKEPPFVAVSGSYKWFDPEGNVQGHRYISDELGYRVMPL